MSQENAKLVDFKGTPKEMKDISEIAKLTQDVLIKDRHINITMADAIPTIAYEFLFSVAQFLDKNKSTGSDTVVNIMNLMEMGVTYRESDDGEKEGNFTPFIQPGTIFKTVIKSDEMTEDDE